MRGRARNGAAGNHVCRRSASCFSFVVTWMERSEIRVFPQSVEAVPGFRFA
jgi:hypothetical protein